MKQIILALALFIPSLSLAAGRTIGTAWDASTSTDVTSYRIYQTTTQGQYTYGAANAVGTVAAPTTTYQYTNLPTGPVWGVVTAVSSSGLESPASNEILLATVPAKPTNLRVTGP